MILLLTQIKYIHSFINYLLGIYFLRYPFLEMEFIRSNSYSLIISSRIHGKEGREGRQGDEEKEKIVKSNKHICLRKGLKLSTFFFFFLAAPVAYRSSWARD